MTTHRGPMSFTVRANEQTPPQKVQKTALSVSRQLCHSLFLCPAEIELSCLIESISTTNPRIEWKKITNEGPSYVYFDKKISGSVLSLMSVSPVVHS